MHYCNYNLNCMTGKRPALNKTTDTKLYATRNARHFKNSICVLPLAKKTATRLPAQGLQKTHRATNSQRLAFTTLNSLAPQTTRLHPCQDFLLWNTFIKVSEGGRGLLTLKSAPSSKPYNRLLVNNQFAMHHANLDVKTLFEDFQMFTTSDETLPANDSLISTSESSAGIRACPRYYFNCLRIWLKSNRWNA